MTINEMIDGYLNAHPVVKQLANEQQLLLGRIFVSVVLNSNPQDHLQRVGELMAYCSVTLTNHQGAEKQLAHVANKAMEIIFSG